MAVKGQGGESSFSKRGAQDPAESGRGRQRCSSWWVWASSSSCSAGDLESLWHCQIKGLGSGSITETWRWRGRVGGPLPFTLVPTIRENHVDKKYKLHSSNFKNEICHELSYCICPDSNLSGQEAFQLMISFVIHPTDCNATRKIPIGRKSRKIFNRKQRNREGLPKEWSHSGRWPQTFISMGHLHEENVWRFWKIMWQIFKWKIRPKSK